MKKLMVAFLLFFTWMLAKSGTSKAYYLEYGIESFPASYRPYLIELQNKHPNWTFTSLYTQIFWDDAINNENVFGRNLVPKSYSDRWKNTNIGQYNVEVDGNWVDCSRQAIEYTMDPRNFLNEIRIFQFENLSSNLTNNTKSNIEKILYGTEMYNNKVNYLDAYGNRIYTDKYYSDLISDASRVSGVNGFHLASRIKQEVGAFLSHKSISGDVEGYRGLYNFYNIGATSSVGQLEAIKKGLQYAMDGKGASIELRNKYLIPWDTKAKAITGGAIFIGSSYINRGQNSIYTQKFHVLDDLGGSLFWHQYMTNVLAAYSEAKSTYTGYSQNNLLDEPINFIIPIYWNMPQIMVENPNIDPTSYMQDNTKVIANVSTSLNVRSGPGTSYETITRAYSQEKMTRISKGIGSGELWDRVVLENGIIGYVFDYYLQEEPKVIISKINLYSEKSIINKNDKIQLQVEVFPNEAYEQKVVFSTSNPKVALVDENGNVLGVGKGITTITARSEDGSVYSSIDIEVYSPVTGLELKAYRKTLQIGNSYQIESVIYPDDANNKSIIYASTDTNIAEVNEDGIITAITKGECNIILTTQEGEIQKILTVTVIEPIPKDKLKFDERLRVEEDEISRIGDTKNTVKDLKNMITTDYEIQIENSKGQLLEDNMLVGTGANINIIDNGDILKTYKVILYGDVNGDGRINSIDLLVLQRHILEIERIDGLFYKAGNIYKNGSKPTSLDLLLIQRHILGLKKIEQ